jgi:glutamate-ammonia-ligase adenylyltransferase
VAECAAFEAYQRDKAATWEHLALTRARVLTPSPRAVEALRRAQHAVRRRPVWAEVEAMRERIVQERARPGVLGNRAESIAYKTGAGGLMDVEFLAQAGVLECGPSAEAERLPSIANLLHGAVRGAGSCALLERYHFLRVLEARNRWVSGRAVERLLCAGESTAAIAELVEPGLSIPALLERIEAARSGIRAAYDRAIAAGSIAALR